MELKQCLENLRHDVSNGGVEDDTFATLCYVTMANEARRIVSDGSSTQEVADAKEYLTLCCGSDSDSLRYIAEA